MSKRERSKGSPRNQSKTPQSGRPVGKLVGAILAFATLLGYVALLPRLSVQPPSPGTDPYNPFSAPFTLTNTGNFSLYAVTATCGAPFGIAGNPASGASSFEEGKPLSVGVDMEVAEFFAPELETDMPRTFVCRNMSSIKTIGQPMVINSCWVTIKADFKLMGFIPWPTKKFGFEARRGEDNKMHWSVMPMAKMPLSSPS